MKKYIYLVLLALSFGLMSCEVEEPGQGTIIIENAQKYKYLKTIAISLGDGKNGEFDYNGKVYVNEMSFRQGSVSETTLKTGEYFIFVSGNTYENGDFYDLTISTTVQLHNNETIRITIYDDHYEWSNE